MENDKQLMVLVVKRGGGTCNITVNGMEIENMKTMKYLPAILNKEGSCETEVDQRIGAASKVIGAMRKEVIDRRELSKALRVMPTLLYACEIWTLLERHKSRMQALEMRCPRRVEGVTILDKVRNVDIRSRLGQVALVLRVEKKKTEWLSNMEEMTEDRMVKKVFFGECARKATEGKTRDKMG